MIVLPLFWDQYDNAQRVHETGFGVRLRTYDFADDELRRAIDRLLASPIRGRLVDLSREIRARDGVARAADAIAGVATGAGAASRR
jgi:UDP:flavonoid glycosyltransferase YjiC (YdhE family)